MGIFNISDEKMQATSSVFTLSEIYQQPATWKKTCAQIAACKDELQAFIDQVVKAEDFDIVLTGAGTSEFVGNSLYQALNTRYNHKAKSFGTTDIVPAPENYLSKTKPTILVSFGRSGNSPESISGNVIVVSSNSSFKNSSLNSSFLRIFFITKKSSLEFKFKNPNSFINASGLSRIHRNRFTRF